VGIFFYDKLDPARASEVEADSNLEALIDFSADILDQSKKSHHLLSLMDRLVQKLDTDDAEDRAETLDSYLTLLKVVRDIVAEIRDSAEDLGNTASRLTREQVLAAQPSLAMTACSHCKLGLDAGELRH